MDLLVMGRARPAATRRQRIHHSAQHCTSLVWRTPWWKIGQSALIRISSSGKPRPGRRTNPARLNHRDSCCGLLSRWSARSRSGSQKARKAEGGHWSRGSSSTSSSRLISRAGPGASGGDDVAGLERGSDRLDGRVDLRLLDDDPVGSPDP